MVLVAISLIPLSAITLALYPLTQKSWFLVFAVIGLFRIAFIGLKMSSTQKILALKKLAAAPINLSILKTWVLSLIRANGYDSITESIDSLGHNLTYLWSICT
uniref:Uncharacterized protein n=1 Tax=Moorena producens (strain JHB) TaxID=1454205 RepID=A0A1D9FW06_MOOP1